MLHVGVCCAVVSIPCSLVVICWERVDLLAVMFVVFCHFPKCSWSTSELKARVAWYFFCGSYMCFFCLVFVMPLYASVYLCLVVTCWDRADLLALD